MSRDGLIFIYNSFSHQKLLIGEADLTEHYKEYHDWKVYEAFTGNITVAEWIKAKEQAQKDMNGPPVPRNIKDYLKKKQQS